MLKTIKYWILEETEQTPGLLFKEMQILNSTIAHALNNPCSTSYDCVIDTDSYLYLAFKLMQ